MNDKIVVMIKFEKYQYIHVGMKDRQYRKTAINKCIMTNWLNFVVLTGNIYHGGGARPLCPHLNLSLILKFNYLFLSKISDWQSITHWPFFFFIPFAITIQYYYSYNVPPPMPSTAAHPSIPQKDPSFFVMNQ